MKKNVQRILATILTVIMMISMLPSNVFAADFDADMFVEPAVEAVSVPAEEQEVESTVEEVPVEADEIAEDISVEDAEAVQGSSEEFETVDAADPAAADEIEETTEAPVVDDKITLKAEGKDYVVTVTYDASALLPDDVKVTAEEIKANAKKYDDYCDQALEAVQQENADVEELSYARLFDIKLVDAAGNVLEPASAVDVQIRLKDVETVEESTQIVHFAGEEEIPEVIEPTVESDTVAFATDGFSIYAVIGTGDYERLTVKFFGKDQENPIDIMWVKEKDKTNGQLDSIIYDLNLGDLEGRYAFYGWSIGKADYSVEDCVNDAGEPIGKTIDDVKDYIRTYDFSDGETLNVYAMLLTYYRVDYIDDEGVSLGSDRALVKVEGADADYIVNKGYSTDSQHHFEGWLPVDGASNITDPAGTTAETRFQNETPIKIKGDVKFSVDVAEGNWLVFDENGKHATYNAPRFIYKDYAPSDPEPEGGNVPDDLLEMKRKGYVFDGWYTADGETFDFDQKLTETTTAYAHWTKNDTAPYTIIIWKEGVTQGTWDFEKTVTFTGNVDDTINTVVPDGSGNDRYAKIDGTDYKYTGFRYDHHDTGVTVTPEGDALVNVYYIRNTYTLRFQSQIWIPLIGHYEFKAITARYGTDISSNFPIRASVANIPLLSEWFSSLARWEAQNGTTFSKPVVFIDTMPAESITFYTDRSLVSEKEMYYYVEALPGDPVDRTFNGKDFTLLSGPLGARYNFFTEDEDFLDIIGYDKYGSQPTFVNGRADGNTLRCYYTRELKTINYMSGAYYDGNGLRTDVGNGQLGTAEGIPYNSDISSYNKGGTNYFEPENPPKGYVFEGWYIDQTCTSPYTFNRMSSGGITVYAKWREIQYRVFLESQADGDTTLTWGSENQNMNFRVSYGDKISAPEGTRTGYKFLGWHKDTNGNIPVYLEGLVLNESTVTEAYDKTKDFTDPSDKWGQKNATYSSDLYDPDDPNRGERWWITKKFVLYASWSKIATGAEGIGIVYDVNGGSGNIYDNVLYQDNTSAVAAQAPKAPNGKVFKGWAVQRWNGTAFEDTGVQVLPGRSFKVLLDNAKIVIEGSVPEQIVTPEYVEQHKDEHYNYTIQVKAVYEDKPVTVKTHITWYKNDGTNEYYRNDTTGAYGDLKINEAVKIYGLSEGETIPSRDGYKFLGWGKYEEAVGPNDAATTPNFLVYNADEQKYYYEGTAAEEVAADEVTPYDALYAIWEYIPHFTIYHSATGEKEEIEFSDDFKEGTKLDLTTELNGIYSGVTPGYLYGGYYRYNEETGEKGTAYTTNGKEMVPEKDTTYYLKEVPDTYLNPRIFITYDTNEGHTPKYALRQLWAIMDLDASCVDGDGNAYGEYGGYGFIIDDDIQIASSKEFICQTLEVNYPDKDKEEYTVKKMFNSGTDEDRLFVRDLTADYLTDTSASAFTLRAYFKTPDGLIVTGKKQRTVHLADRTFAADAAPSIQWKQEGGGIWQETATPGSEVAADTRSLWASTTIPSVLTYKIKSTPDILTYTVTKVDDGKNESQVVQAGDNTGKITYAGKTGYVFAGWYLDKAYTKAADFSVVTGDMTVYAKYVKATAIGLSFTKKSSKSGSVTLNATLKITGAPDLADAAVSCDYKGKTSTVKFTGAKTTKNGKTTVSTYAGTVAISGLANKSSFKAAISYKTPDGTYVSLADKTCKYTSGKVTVK